MDKPMTDAEIDRFSHYPSGMWYSPQGDYVRYDHHAKAIRQRDEEIERLKEMYHHALEREREFEKR